MSTQPIYQAILQVVQRRLLEQEKLQILDVGAGRGDLLQHLANLYPITASACDFHVERFALADVPIQKVDLNQERLPYPDGSFHLVTCSEVIEHLENFRALMRDVHRVLKPGGLFVLTTPNILNVKSRLRFFASGFYNLFGPLPVKNDRLYSTGGHITPVAYFHIGHAMLDVGFTDIEPEIDRLQTYSLIGLAITFPFILVGWLSFLHQERRIYKTLTDSNQPLVLRHNGLALLAGRTVIVSGYKALTA